MTPTQILGMIGPSIALLFALIFLFVRRYSENRAYLNFLAIGFAAFGLGVGVEIVHWPPDAGWNAMLTTVFYTVGALASAEGVMRRKWRTLGAPFWGFTLVVIGAGSYHFHYVDPSLLVRIYILNFGIAIVLALSVFKLRDLRQGKPVDRLIWWTFLLFALHFFPRILLTAGNWVPTDAMEFVHSAFWIGTQLALSVFSAVLGAVLLTAVLVDMIEALKQDRDHDALTGLLNRGGFERTALAHMADPANMPTSLMICDIDHFKSINDSHGHAIGDLVLKEFAMLLRQSLRSIDVVGRIGGEEFVALLPDCDEQGLQFLIERLRQQVMNKRYACLPADQKVTASFGLSSRQPGEPLWDWYARTDAALYEAKSGGRNRIIATHVEARPGVARDDGIPKISRAQ